MNFKNKRLLKKEANAVGWGMNFLSKFNLKFKIQFLFEIANSDGVLNVFEVLSWGIRLFNVLENSNQP